MKSKIIYIFVLFSLSLNIFHDLIILQEAKSSCQTITQVMDKHKHDTCCSDIVDLHKVFHFMAILSNNLSLHYSPSSQELFSLKVFLPQFIIESSFKPPRV